MSDRATIGRILTWHLEVGVDETIGETPVDRFQSAVADEAAQPDPVGARQAAGRQPSPPPRTTGFSDAAPRPVSPSAAKTPPPSNEESVKTAVELALRADSVAELRSALEQFDGCALKKTATNLVFTDGNPEARLVFVGEAPGAQEDRQGLPFVGPSGALLDRMLASIGIAREEVLISNTVFWRPPGNRTPTPQETAICMPFVERLIEIVDPDVLVTLGGPAAKALLGETQGVGRLRGRWFSFQTPRLSHPVEATAMFHPAYLLRTPAQKRSTWQDLLSIREKLAAHPVV